MPEKAAHRDRSKQLIQLLRSGSLADKLLPISVGEVDRSLLRSLADEQGFVPVREGSLAFSQDRVRFPKLKSSSSAADRGKALHFFANHELLAIELLAYALVKYPDDPPGLHASLLRTLAEEQTHLKMYLDRMAELGVTLGDFALNGHFWQLLAPARDAVAFSCGMNLTFEQANLDFAAFYERKFAAIGDDETAKIMAVIAEDEISHVSRGVYIVAKAMQADGGLMESSGRAKESGDSEGQGKSKGLWSFYRRHLPEAISPMRAKGTTFERSLRRKAKLDNEFIDELATYRESASQRSRLFYFNSDCERELQNPHYSRSPAIQQRMATSEYLFTLLAQPGDGVLVSREPSLLWRQHLAGLGLPVVQPLLVVEGVPDSSALKYLRRNFAASTSSSTTTTENATPNECLAWGQTPRAAKLAQQLSREIRKDGETALRQELKQAQTLSLPSKTLKPEWFSKLQLPALRQRLAKQIEVPIIGEVVHSLERLEQLLASVPRSVIKSPFGAAGSGLHFIDSLDTEVKADRTAVQFARSRLASTPAQPLLWEPRWQVEENYSAVGYVAADGEVTLSAMLPFATSINGQYLGHTLSPARDGHQHPADHNHKAALMTAFTFAGKQLAAEGYLGAFGIDAFIGRSGNSQLALQPLSEINSRYTMGHFAAVLCQHLAAPARWQFVPRKAIVAAGYSSSTSYAEHLLARHPMRKTHGAGGLWQQGVAILSDWQQDATGLSVLAVGEPLLSSTGSGAGSETCVFLSEIC